MTNQKSEIFLKIREILNRHDPMGLMGIAPEDEYDPETEQIAAMVNGFKTEQDAIKGVKQVFEKMFAEVKPVNPESYGQIGKEILALN